MMAVQLVGWIVPASIGPAAKAAPAARLSGAGERARSHEILHHFFLPGLGGVDDRVGQVVVTAVGAHDIDAGQQDRGEDDRDAEDDADGDVARDLGRDDAGREGDDRR